MSIGSAAAKPQKPPQPGPRPLSDADRRKNRQGAVVFFGLAVLALLSGIVENYDWIHAQPVDGTVTALTCRREAVSPGGTATSDGCRPTVRYRDGGEEKLLYSRLRFGPGKLQVGQTLPVNLNVYPIEVLSAEHHFTWLAVSILGAIALVWTGIYFLRAKRGLVSDTELPEDYLPEDDERPERS